MKEICFCILIFLGILNIQFAFAQQKIKEGKVTFTFSFPDEEKVDQETFSRNEVKGSTYYFKNGLTRVEYHDDNQSTYIIDPKKKDIYILKDNLALKQTFEEANENQAFLYGDTIAQITNETKMIAGFKCQKALYTYPVWQKPSRTIEIWFTNDISATNFDFNFKGIDGFIMEYSLTDLVIENNLEVDFRKIMTCSKVESETVPDELFKVPNDYMIMTWDEFKKGARDGHVK